MIKNLKIAGNFWDRFRGLMFKKSISKDEGIMFLNCSRVHTFFMRFDILVIYLDKEFNILFHEILEPGKVGSKIKGTKNLIETSAEVEMNINCMTKVVLTMEERENV